jgi:Fe-S-cluster-containing hydrogenase component 2
MLAMFRGLREREGRDGQTGRRPRQDREEVAEGPRDSHLPVRRLRQTVRCSCPVEAISVDKGIVRIDRNTCTGCETCVSACPYGAIFMDADGLAFKCDFCGGDPACVKECVYRRVETGGV